MAQSKRVVNVTALIDERGLGSFQIGIFALCAVAALLDGIDIQSVGPTVPALAAALHAPMSAFGSIFGVAQVGFLLGALSLGPIADRVGRKWPLILAMFWFAGFMLVTPFADSLTTLFAIRFCTGLGLGGMSVNAVALMSEYAPRRARARLVSALWAAFPLGGTLAAFAASVIIPHWGWRWVFLCGGVLPLVYAFVLIAKLPESLKFLVARDADPARIGHIIARLAPEAAAGGERRYRIDEEKLPGVPIKYLFTDRRAVTTFCLWGASFVSWLVIIVEGSWTPVLMNQAGYTIAAGSVILGFLNGGATLAMIGVGFLIDRWGAYRVLAWCFVLGGLGLFAIGIYPSSFALTLVVATLAGIFTGATGSGTIALAAMSYPVAMRSTGVGWSLGIGRIGAVVGPIAAGNLMAMHYAAGQILIALAVPCVLAALLMPVLRLGAARQARRAETAAVAP
jgi:MFS transporter, AAHS family, 4-hydroxybenzoate transporter